MLRETFNVKVEVSGPKAPKIGVRINGSAVNVGRACQQIEKRRNVARAHAQHVVRLCLFDPSTPSAMFAERASK